MVMTGYTVGSSGQYECTLQSHSIQYIENNRDQYAELLSPIMKQTAPAVVDRPSARRCPRTRLHTCCTRSPDFKVGIKAASSKGPGRIHSVMVSLASWEVKGLRLGQTVTSSLCTTVHPLYTRFTKRFSASISETTM